MMESLLNRVTFIRRVSTPFLISRLGHGCHDSGGPYEGRLVITLTSAPSLASSSESSKSRCQEEATSGA